jgi:hypothetical protein
MLARSRCLQARSYYSQVPWPGPRSGAAWAAAAGAAAAADSESDFNKLTGIARWGLSGHLQGASRCMALGTELAPVAALPSGHARADQGQGRLVGVRSCVVAY